MALTKLEENLSVIENLPDSPTLEPVELKRKFDEGAIKIKEYINEVLTAEIDKLITSTKKEMTNAINTTKKEITNTINTNKNTMEKTFQEQLKKRYYVGKIIMDTKNVNPASYLGFGTWKLWGTGRVPVGVNTADSAFNTVEKVGGAKTHTLTVEQLPAHDHPQNVTNPVTSGANASGRGDYDCDSKKLGVYSQGISTGKTGGSKSFNILQPYITCYMWKRTA